MIQSKQHYDFKTIVESYQEKVRNTCFRFVRNREDAEDVAQEVFIQVYDSMDRFRNESQLSTWIYRIAVNKSLDFIRRKKRKKRFAKLTSIFGLGEDSPDPEPSSDKNPQTDLEDRERRQVLNSAIERLPRNQQAAVTLSKYDGFSNREIAEIMDMSLSAVDALIHRAKKNLQKFLYEYFEKKM